MSELKRNKTDNIFFQELINRFFHSHSYFFVCLKYYLENSSLIKTDETTHQILTHAIHFLTESKDAVAELKEISKIRGFETTYNVLESQLTQINFRTRQQSQLKKAIQSLALFLLNKLAQSLIEDEKRCRDLGSYLKLKTSLKQLFNGSNGTSLLQNYEIAHSQNSNGMNKANTNSDPLNIQGKPLASHDPIRYDGSMTLLNFNHDADRLLKPLTVLLLQQLEQIDQSSFIEQVQTRFYKLQGLAMYTGIREVEQIAGRVLFLLEVISDNHVPLNEYILELVNRATAAIQNKTYHLQNDTILNDLFNDFDQFISSLNNQILNNHREFDQDESLNEIESQLDSFQQGALSSDLNLIDQNQTSEPVLDINEIVELENANGNHDIANSATDNRNLKFALRNETDNSISGLISEIGSTETSPSPGFIDKFNEIEKSNKAFSMLDPHQEANNGKDDNYLYRAIFSKEAEGYYKMILNAIIKLKGEGNAQSCLEDIELASYSIKHLARKFGMEKIAALPEIIEYITYQANKRLVKLPAAIVLAIEEGISLLAIFDHHQHDHKIRFTSILASLKQYYTKTFQTGDMISVVP